MIDDQVWGYSILRESHCDFQNLHWGLDLKTVFFPSLLGLVGGKEPQNYFGLCRKEWMNTLWVIVGPYIYPMLEPYRTASHASNAFPFLCGTKMRTLCSVIYPICFGEL